MIEIVHDEKCAWVAYPKWLSCDCVRLKLQHLESENAALNAKLVAAQVLVSIAQDALDCMNEAWPGRPICTVLARAIDNFDAKSPKET